MFIYYKYERNKKLTKPAFDITSIISAAGELKYVSQIKKIIGQQFITPEEEFIRFFASKVYGGMAITQKVKDQFKPLIVKAAQQYLSDQINERLKSVITQSTVKQSEDDSVNNLEIDKDNDNDNDLVATQDEIDGFNVVRAIVCSVIDIKKYFKEKQKVILVYY